MAHRFRKKHFKASAFTLVGTVPCSASRAPAITTDLGPPVTQAQALTRAGQARLLGSVAVRRHGLARAGSRARCAKPCFGSVLVFVPSVIGRALT